VPLYKLDERGRPTGQYSHDARYVRLRIENTGLSSIRDCCGLTTELAKYTPPTKARLFPLRRFFICL
jgi:hypothetical protein